MATEERRSLTDADISTVSVRQGARPSPQRSSMAMQDADQGDADGSDTGDKGDSTDTTDRGDTTDHGDSADRADATDGGGRA